MSDDPYAIDSGGCQRPEPVRDLKDNVPGSEAVNEDLATRYAQALQETLGWEGRMIGSSKSGYVKAHPGHAPVFNANVCVDEGKLWHGDLDLAVDEERLAALAARIGKTIYVLYEGDARFKNEDEPLLAQAVYSVTPSGHTRFGFRTFERSADGTLRRRPSPPRRRWRWRVLAHRPRLLRFWIAARTRKPFSAIEQGCSTQLRIGGRDDDATPQLVLDLSRGRGLRLVTVETTWYPGGDHGRSAGRSLLKLNPHLHLGPVGLWANLVIWPGRIYQLQVGYLLRGDSRSDRTTTR